MKIFEEALKYLGGGFVVYLGFAACSGGGSDQVDEPKARRRASSSMTDGAVSEAAAQDVDAVTGITSGSATVDCVEWSTTTLTTTQTEGDLASETQTEVYGASVAVPGLTVDTLLYAFAQLESATEAVDPCSSHDDDYSCESSERVSVVAPPASALLSPVSLVEGELFAGCGVRVSSGSFALDGVHAKSVTFHWKML